MAESVVFHGLQDTPNSSTRNLRYHLQGQHGYSVQNGKTGPPNSAEQAAIFEWFEHLMKSQGKKKNSVKNQNKHEGKRKGKGKGKVDDKEVVKDEEEEYGDENECY
ncbi:hypothetical protein N7528_006623 [Penicillium herquei]|nr:hypothetical protein N7528_006623 [Penicillium herquei]